MKFSHFVPEQEDKTAVDAVEAAVSVFEGSKYFNAGVGSFLNNFGEVECDAMIMDGNKINTGIPKNFFCKPLTQPIFCDCASGLYL